MNIVAAIKGVKRVFYGWWIVLASSLIYAYGTGTFFYGFSVFFRPMVDEFGWDRAVTAGAFSLSRLEGGIDAPVTGWFIDRIGPRKVVLFGIILAGIGFFSLHWINSLLSFYLIYGIVLSLGYNIGFNQAHYAAVSNWFIRKRSRAISLLAVGGGIGGTVVLPIVAWIVSTQGWRTAVMIIGIGMWVVGLPLAMVIRHRPEHHGLLPDGDKASGGAAADTAAITQRNDLSASDFTVKEALVTVTFWLLIVAMVLRAFVTGAVVVHEITYLIDLGVNELIAASALSMMTLASIPGRLLFGWLGDFYSKARLLAISSIVQAVGVLFFANATWSGAWLLGVPVEIVFFVIIYGLGYGASIPLGPALRADFFGRKAYATISGLMSPFNMIGTVAGPVFAGFIYDTTKSYYIAFMVFAVTFTLSGLTFLFLKPPKKKEPALVIA